MAANITEKPLGCRIDLPDDSRRVEDIARDSHVVQSQFDVTANGQASYRPCHAESVADPGRR
jgi:hypothetical protein